MTMTLNNLKILNGDPTLAQSVAVIAANAMILRAYDPARVRRAVIDALARWSYGGSTLYEIALDAPTPPSLEVVDVDRREGARDVVRLALSFRLAMFRAKCTTDTMLGSYADPVLTADAIEVRGDVRLAWPDASQGVFTFDLERAGGVARAVNAHVSGNDNVLGDIVWGVVDLFLPDELSTTFDLASILRPLVARGNAALASLADDGVGVLREARLAPARSVAGPSGPFDLVAETAPMRLPNAAQLGWWTASERHLIALHDMDTGRSVASAPIDRDATRLAALPMLLAAREALQTHLASGLAARGFAEPDVTVRPRGQVTFEFDPAQEPGALYLRALLRGCALEVSCAGRPDANLAADLAVHLRVGVPGVGAPGVDGAALGCAAAVRAGEGASPEVLNAVLEALRDEGPLATGGDPAAPLGARLREYAGLFARELMRPATEALAREPERRPVATLVLPGHAASRAASRVFGDPQAQGVAVLAASARGAATLRGDVRWDSGVVLPLGAPVQPTDQVTARVAVPRPGGGRRREVAVIELPRAVSLAPQFSLQARRLFPAYFDEGMVHLPEFTLPCGAVAWGEVARDGDRPRAIAFAVEAVPAGAPLTLQLDLGAVPARAPTGGSRFLATRVTANWLGDLELAPDASTREGLELRIGAVPAGYDPVADPQGAAAMIDPRVNPSPAARRPVSVFASRSAKTSLAAVAAGRRAAAPG